MTAARDRKRTRSPRSMWTSMGRSVSGGDPIAKYDKILKPIYSSSEMI